MNGCLIVTVLLVAWFVVPPLFRDPSQRRSCVSLEYHEEYECCCDKHGMNRLVGVTFAEAFNCRNCEERSGWFNMTTEHCQNGYGGCIEFMVLRHVEMMNMDPDPNAGKCDCHKV